MAVPEFQGRFKNPYWILYRIIKYHMEMTTKESGLFCKMFTGHSNTNIEKKTIAVIDAKEAIRRLIPTLKKYGLYKKFVEYSKTVKQISQLMIAKKFMLGISQNA